MRKHIGTCATLLALCATIFGLCATYHTNGALGTRSLFIRYYIPSNLDLQVPTPFFHRGARVRLLPFLTGAQTSGNPLFNSAETSVRGSSPWVFETPRCGAGVSKKRGCPFSQDFLAFRSPEKGKSRTELPSQIPLPPPHPLPFYYRHAHLHQSLWQHRRAAWLSHAGSAGAYARHAPQEHVQDPLPTTSHWCIIRSMAIKRRSLRLVRTITVGELFRYRLV